MRRNVCSIGLLLIDLSPRTYNWLHFCTNTQHILSNCFIPQWLNDLKSLNSDHLKFLYSQSVEVVFVQMQKSFPSVLPKRIYQVVPLRRHSKSAESKPAKHTKNKNITWLNFKTKFGFFSLKLATWKQRKDLLESEKSLQVMKVITPPGLVHLFWHGAVCSCLCFCVQQKFENTVSY